MRQGAGPPGPGACWPAHPCVGKWGQHMYGCEDARTAWQQDANKQGQEQQGQELQGQKLQGQEQQGQEQQEPEE